MLFFHPYEDRDTIFIMIIDAISATQIPEGAKFPERAVASFLKFIEKKLDVSIIRNVRGIPVDQSLLEPMRLAELLQEKGVIKKIGRTVNFPDEPPTKSWYAICNDPLGNPVGGTTWESSADALYATLAEALERYLWIMQEDYFVDPTIATKSNIQKKGPFVAPERFAGFSEAQRAGNSDRQLRQDAEYLWIRGTSLVQGAYVYLPAQVVSSSRPYNRLHAVKEPLIRQRTTIGLATWPTQTGARLAGALEVIEREAYMIMWLNQLTLPRISLTPLRDVHPSLNRSLAMCERYGFKTHAIQLLTDAPTHAIAVVMEDMSGNAPRFSIGLKAHRSLPFAIQKAMTEALRAHLAYRKWSATGNTWDMKTPVHEVGHRERLQYWGVPEHAKQLEFLIQGPEIELGPKEWDNDDDEAQLRRILHWCAEKKFECISVSLGTSSKNPTSLHVEMVVIPELQPTYLTEFFQAFGADRWKEVPATLGYAPLKKPFVGGPHPFS